MFIRAPHFFSYSLLSYHFFLEEERLRATHTGAPAITRRKIQFKTFCSCDYSSQNSVRRNTAPAVTRRKIQCQKFCPCDYSSQNPVPEILLLRLLVAKSSARNFAPAITRRKIQCEEILLLRLLVAKSSARNFAPAVTRRKVQCEEMCSCGYSSQNPVPEILLLRLLVEKSSAKSYKERRLGAHLRGSTTSSPHFMIHFGFCTKRHFIQIINSTTHF